MEHKVAIINFKDKYQRFFDNWAVVLYKTTLLVASGFNDYRSAENWIDDYNDSHEHTILKLMKHEEIEEDNI